MKEEGLWALTSYYNPFKGQRRRHNFDIFRARLGVPLIAVEWAPDGLFELGPGDADVLVQVRDGDLLWQKERLLNIGLTHLPDDCTHVAAIDCDVFFGTSGWAKNTIHSLHYCDAVQLFGQVVYLPEAPVEVRDSAELARLTPESRLQSMAVALAAGKGLFSPASSENTFGPAGHLPTINGIPGMGLAFHADMIRELQFYDANIVGAGDMVLFSALTNRLEENLTCRGYAPRHADHVRIWARRAKRSGKSALGVVQTTLYHLWHGKLADRRYGERHQILARLGYDPDRHLSPHKHGAWSWSACAGDLAAQVRGYLESRHDA